MALPEAAPALFDKPHAFRVLAFSGGGLRGLAYIGALRALTQRWGINLEKTVHFAGTSIGALVALLLALDLSIDDIESLAMTLPLEQLLWGRVSELWTALQRRGWNSGNRLVSQLEQIIADATGRTNLRMDDLPLVCGHHLTVVVTDLESCEPVYISTRDPDQFGHVPVALAVAASMRLPGIFVPETSLPIAAPKQQQHPPSHTRSDAMQRRNDADGGLLDNFPLPYVCKLENASPHECFGMRVMWKYAPPTTTTTTTISTATVSQHARSQSLVEEGIRQGELVFRALTRASETLKWREIEEQSLQTRVLTFELPVSMLYVSGLHNKRRTVDLGYDMAQVDLARLEEGETVSCLRGRVVPLSEIPLLPWWWSGRLDGVSDGGVWGSVWQALETAIGQRGQSSLTNSRRAFVNVMLWVLYWDASLARFRRDGTVPGCDHHPHGRPRSLSSPPSRC